MAPKYYTPFLNEFHDQFEYEELDLVWKKKVFDFRDLEIIHDELLEGKLRVKHLDRQDVEECGWIQDSNLNNEENPDLFDIHGFSIGYHKEYGDVQFIIYHFPDGFVIIESIKNNSHGFENMHFRGTIKNKSELKKIMVQLGIN